MEDDPIVVAYLIALGTVVFIASQDVNLGIATGAAMVLVLLAARKFVRAKPISPGDRDGDRHQPE